MFGLCGANLEATYSFFSFKFELDPLSKEHLHDGESGEYPEDTEIYPEVKWVEWPMILQCYRSLQIKL